MMPVCFISIVGADVGGGVGGGGDFLLYLVACEHLNE
jgi:hypothetical protein